MIWPSLMKSDQSLGGAAQAQRQLGGATAVGAAFAPPLHGTTATPSRATTVSSRRPGGRRRA